MNLNNQITENKILEILETITDPEIPVLSLLDLGIVRYIRINNDSRQPFIEIGITPTYSGCPAMHTIEWNIRTALLEQGYKHVSITTVLSPAWTTSWMSEAGKQKLIAYGIAAPQPMASVCHLDAFAKEEAIPCPRCNSYHTHLLSQFGSTACKALYQCQDCQEPFDYFKCH